MPSLLFLAQAAIFFATVVAMEGVAYFAHRYLFHAILWPIHRSHHEPRTGRFELNDVFGLFFVPVSMALMGGWLAPNWLWVTFPIGTGMTAYGFIYFFIHDVYTHRRFFKLNFENEWLRDMRSAHRRHHSNCGRGGQEPFGFVYFGKR